MAHSLKRARKKSKKIYTLTTIGEYEETRPNGTTFKTHRDRCVGWASTKALARKWARENKFDAGEAGYYQFIVIEEIGEGLYGGGCMWQEFYRIPRSSRVRPRCKKIARPHKWRNLCGWGIG